MRVLGPDGAGRCVFLRFTVPPGEQPDIETNLRPDELIIGLRRARGTWTRRSGLVKVRDRQSYEFALASAAVALELRDGSDRGTARIGLGGVATTPWRAEEAEAIARRPSPSPALFRQRQTPPSQARNRATAIATRSLLGKRTLMRRSSRPQSAGLTMQV